MALSANTVWEVRPTNGSNTNGGGWVAGSSGTDLTQRDTPAYSVTDAVADGTTNVTSATANFGTDVVGNVAYINGAWYHITARPSTSSLTTDRNVGAGSGLTLKIGGALATRGGVIAAGAVTGNATWIKAEAALVETTTFQDTRSAPASTNVQFNRWIGYGTTRGDNTRAIIRAGANSITLHYNTVAGQMLQNLEFDGNVASYPTAVVGINVGAAVIQNCYVHHTSGLICGINTGLISDCTFRNCSVGTAPLISSSSGFVQFFNNWVDALTGTSYATFNINSGYGYFFNNIFSNCSGHSSSGLTQPPANGFLTVLHNTFYNNTYGWIRGNSTYSLIKNNIFAKCGAKGLDFVTALPAYPWFDGNAYWSNTANRTNADIVTGIHAVNPYTNVLDNIVTDGDPFVDAVNNDFRLNATALRGLKLRSCGVPGAHPVGLTNYPDFGAMQYQGRAAEALVSGSPLVH